MTYSRKSFSGAAVATTLSANILSTDLTINVGATTGWPNTANGPFVVCIDRGTASEEKVLIQSFTGTTLTVAAGGRGYDGTTAVPHSSGADCRHTLDATTINNHETFVAGNGTVTPAASAVGDAANDGSSAVPAAADHKHAREAFATGATTNSNPGDTELDGSSLSPARADHRHARESNPLGLPLALTGAVAATRFVGGTASGAPTTGTFVAGDFVIDQTGVIWVCVTGGTPGSWLRIGPGANPSGQIVSTATTAVLNNTDTQVANMSSSAAGPPAAYLKGGMTLSGNNLVVPVAGIYKVTGSVLWAQFSAASPYAVSFIYHNGTAVTAASAPTPAGGDPQACCTVDVVCAANDTLGLWCYQLEGTFTGAQAGSYLSATLVSQ